MTKAVDKVAKKRKSIGRPPSTPIDSPELRERFLEVLRQTGNVADAAEAINVYRTTPYQWKKKDAKFSRDWEIALEQAADIVEAEVRRRAVEGYDEPVFYQGKEVGKVRKYSDRMLELLIKGLKPEKYREKALPDAAVVIKVEGLEQIQQLRASHPWGRESPLIEGEDGKFKPVTIELEDLSAREKASLADKTGRPSKQGYTAAELAEEKDNE